MTTSRKFILIAIVLLVSCSREKKSTIITENDLLKISVSNTDQSLWEYTLSKTGKSYSFQAPEFELDGKLYPAALSSVTLAGNPKKLKNGVTEYKVEGNFAEVPDITLRILFRVAENNPIIRFRYELVSESAHQLTKANGHDQIIYLHVSLNGSTEFKEVRFSEFNEQVHSYNLSERKLEQKHFADGFTAMGPMFVASDRSNSFLIAYEHGSQVPDRFLEYVLNPDNSISLKAVKGNYYQGYKIDKENFYSTVWFETGAVAGDEDLLADNYRSFMLHYMSLNAETRKPYIFYNTWNFQERNHHWYKKPYLADMTYDRMSKEIDVAHRMGIDVFVIDAGWFEKTGDWNPSLKRFPDSLKRISKQLKENGMKLGLWFNPTVAAVSSDMLKANKNNIRTMNGSEGEPEPIWETEESYGLCLVSPYRDAFADKLIQLYKELGVTYFKWDAVGQYECNDPRHFHGNENNTPQERLETYAFELGRAMSYVVDKLTEECPEAIVDFDITEGGRFVSAGQRSVGLSFLSSGKYFLVNNGPYFFNYNIPIDLSTDQWNIFFYPGPARGWICRTPLAIDKWIPSILFLAHYMPDDPYENQSIAVGSLILGQNGIWGDLLRLSDKGIDFFDKTLGLYKQVRNDITEATIIRDGAIGGNPEIYEKVNAETGKGAVVIFANHPGKYEYVSHHKVDQKYWATKGVDVTFDKEGRAVIKATVDRISTDITTNDAEAKIIFFGVDGNLSSLEK